MKAFVFPGQGAQFEGMGKELYMDNPLAKKIFDEADEILGFKLSKIMFEGSSEELKETKVTQPALFVHAMATAAAHPDQFVPAAVAGHSLGEFSALVAAKSLSFEEGLKLVLIRALAMQKACEMSKGTMSAILGLDNEVVENVCDKISDEIVVPANYNCDGQIVISGSLEGIEKANFLLKEAGARRTVVLPVGGAFHSPLMEPAKAELKEAIDKIVFAKPICPIYQNVTAMASVDPDEIKNNLVSQLTGSVRWTQTVKNMIADGFTTFVECGGNGKVLSGLIKKTDRSVETQKL